MVKQVDIIQQQDINNINMHIPSNQIYQYQDQNPQIPLPNQGQ
jgi:hypothetical protein